LKKNRLHFWDQISHLYIPWIQRKFRFNQNISIDIKSLRICAFKEDVGTFQDMKGTQKLHGSDVSIDPVAFVFVITSPSFLPPSYTDNTGTTILRNHGIYLPVETVQHDRRLESSITPLWEPEILHGFLSDKSCRLSHNIMEACLPTVLFETWHETHSAIKPTNALYFLSMSNNPTHVSAATETSSGVQGHVHFNIH
jgi:hypothetical protein